MFLDLNSILRFDTLTTMVLFGVVQTLLILYFFIKNKRYRSHFLLVYIIIILLIMQTESFLLQSGIMYYCTQLFTFSAPFIFLLGPFFLEYTKSQIKGWHFSKIKLLHLVPFIFYFFYSFYFFLQPTEIKQGLYLQSFRPDLTINFTKPSFSIDPLNIRGWVVVELISLHLLIYCFITFYVIFKSKKMLVKKGKKKLKWLLYINCILLFATLIIFFSHGGVINSYTFFESPFPNISPDLFSVVSMYLITIYILSKPDLFKVEEKKYYKSTLPSFYKKQKSNQIRSYIEDEKLYLKTDFSMKMLSDKCGVTTHNISQILNEELQMSFNELTNKYRINYAKKILKNKSSDIKIEQLAYDLGYKSKSTFFRIFKDATGMTPSQYKKQGTI